MRGTLFSSLVRLAAPALAALSFAASPLAAQHGVVASANVGVSSLRRSPSTDGNSPSFVKVAARLLPRGTVLTERDIALTPATNASATTPIDTAARAGWVTRRLVRAGEVLRAPAVAPAPLFHANHPVRFLVQRDGFQLSLDGVAVIAASLGDTIPVRLGAKRRLSGVVSGRDEVVALDSLRNP